MSISGTRITAPVRLDEPYRLMGIPEPEGGYDLAYLCSNAHGCINTASRRKPVIHSSPGEISTSAAASPSATSVFSSVMGVYFGLRMSERSGRLYNLHYCRFDYNPPVPRLHWQRLTDFIGYDHGAVFTPVGSLPAFGYTDRAEGLEVVIDASSGTSTGVSVAEAIKYSTVPDAELSEMYPCILISKYGALTGGSGASALATGHEAVGGNPAFVVDGYNYVRALRSNATGTYSPLGTGGVFTAEINSIGAAGANAPEFMNEEGEALATVFFVRKLSDKAFGFDLTKWTPAGGIMLGIGESFVCPGAVSKVIALKRYYSKGVGAYSFSLSKSTGSWRCRVYMNWIEPSAGASYRVTLMLFGATASGSELQASWGEGYTVLTYDPTPGIIDVLSYDFPLSVLAVNMPDGKYTLRWAVYDAADTSRYLNGGELTQEMLFAKT
ncbi:MAG: hypothetical protein NC193_09940 [bacterium]|nr:hypothetical protein [bacterium]